MENNVITGLDILMFVSMGEMSITPNADGTVVFHTTDVLAEGLSQQFGFEVSSDGLNQLLSHFAEAVNSMRYTVEKSEEDKVVDQ